MEQATAKISKTAVWAAAARAIGARESDPTARNPDYLAEQLLGDPAELAIETPMVHALTQNYDEAARNAAVINNVRLMMVRTRFIDDALTRAISDGATQVVILGAGFDSHAYRFQSLLEHVRVFEVDRPATQEFKRHRVAAALGGAPSNLTYVAIDFDRENLPHGLARHGYDRSRRTFFIMEGVVMYLSEQAARTTLAFVANHPPGSAVVFDFLYTPMVEQIAKLQSAQNLSPTARAFADRFLTVIQDEPWLTGLPADGEREYLQSLGLAVREVLHVGGPESVRRYLTRADGTHVGAPPAAVRGEDAEPSEALPEPAPQQQRLMGYHLADAMVP